MGASPESNEEHQMPPLSPDATTDEVVEHILDHYRNFTVVGASPRPSRASHGVMGVLANHGYEVIPVNPNVDEVRGSRSYPDLHSVSEVATVEVVDIFRRSDAVGPHVDEAIAVGAKAIWMQLGVIDEEAAARAREAGLLVVMDRCPAIELGQR